jgi:D-alanyl-lipoteichoic acid acyltransferase DltB (MBOAT superfamily)
MLFNTPQYFVFFAIVLVVYYALTLRAQNAFLLAASYFFYGSWDYRFLSLLFLSTVIDYTAGLAIHAAALRGDRRRMRAALVLSVGSQLAILGFFKYFNFFADTAASLLAGFGFHPSLPALQVILPVGISFYTFQTMSYTIDIYRGAFAPTRNFVDFALSVAFFPHLVAGPIQRARSLIIQIERPRTVTRDLVDRGLTLFIIGLVRKVAIADPAGALADAYFADPASYTSIPLACGLMLYGLQIYNDFAGYSEMARGSANLLGFDLMRNFRHPYFAASISEFWQRWHISLSTWLRDYLYIPLGGNRKGPRRTYINLMLTMLLGGLWHGASWNFVIWGGLHGAYLVGYHAWNSVRVRAAEPARYHAISRIASGAAVYALVTFTWLFFRSHDLATTGAYLRGLFAFTPGYGGALMPFAVLAAMTLAIDVPQAIADDECMVLEWRLAPRAAFVAASMLLLLFSGNLGHEAFIYFQF